MGCKLDREPAGPQFQERHPWPLSTTGRTVAYFLLCCTYVRRQGGDRFCRCQGMGRYGMSDELIGKYPLSRRRLLGATAGLGLLGPSGMAFGQPSGPWAQAPRSKVDRVNFVVWTYGDIYTRIAKQFETD